MLTRIVVATVIVGAVAAAAAAPILFDARGDERGAAISSYIDTLDMMTKATDLPNQAVADPI